MSTIHGQKLKMARNSSHVKPPQRGTSISAGIDFFIPNNWNDGKPKFIKPGEKEIIKLGIYVDLIGSGLGNYALIFQNKSGIATKKGLVVGACVIDADYQGELMLHLYNPTNKDVELEPGKKAIQGVLQEVNYAEPEMINFEELYETNTDRGDGWAGSTGE